MESVGTVVSIDKDMAVVNVRRVSACGENCASCKGGCVSTTLTTKVYNKEGAKVGDVVKIESNSNELVRAAFFLYIVPVIIGIIASVASYAMKMSDIFVILVFLVSFFASFLLVKYFEKRLVPKSYITKILGKDVN